MSNSLQTVQSESTAPSTINYAQNPIVNEAYNNIVNAMDTNCFKGIEESEDPASKLSKFYTNTFKVGDSNTFEILSNEYETAINTATSKMDDYVATASAAKTAIEAAIAQDQLAHKLAVEARDTVAETYPAFVQEYDTKGNPTNSYVEYCEEKAAAMDAAYNNTWNAKCWKG